MRPGTTPLFIALGSREIEEVGELMELGDRADEIALISGRAIRR
jgi:hypothetical protein